MASQINIVLRMLRENDWVCGTTFQRVYIPTYAQRVSDLVKKGHKVLAFDRYNSNNHYGWLEKSKYKKKIEFSRI